FLFLRDPRETREAADRVLALKPNLNAVEWKVFAYLQEGDLAGVRVTLAAPPDNLDVTALIADFAWYGTSWVMNREQQALLFRLPPAAFGEQRASWALTLADAYWVSGNIGNARKLAEQAQAAFQADIRQTPTAYQPHVKRAFVLAILGRKQEAAEEGSRALNLARDFGTRGLVLPLLSLAYAVDGDEERAITATEQALEAQTYLTPAYLQIDPHHAPLRSTQRCQKLLV